MKRQICVVAVFCLLAGETMQAMDVSKQIFEAALSGNIVTVQELIGQGVNVDSRTDNGNTPLHAAAAKGHLDIVQLLLAKEADINAQDNNDLTPLHQAAIGHRLNVAHLLLDRGARINIQDNKGNTALHLTVLFDCPDITKALIIAGANPFLKDKEGRTPFDLAKDYKGYKPEELKNFMRVLGLEGPEVNLKCPICIDEKQKTELAVLPCGHYICRECLQELQNQLNRAGQQVIQANERLIELEQQEAPREQIIEVFQERQNLISLLQSGLTCPICRKPFKFEEVY